jgi:pimeloyl-ACP methyl ester carboxylesterase
MLRTVILVSVLACAIAAFGSAEESAESLHDEMQSKNSELIQRGFNFTSSFVLGGDTRVLHLDVLVPPSEGTHELSFWTHAVGGDVKFTVVSSDDRVLASWHGQSGDTNFALILPVGRDRIEVNGSRADSVFGLVAIKGPVLSACQLDPARVSMHSANDSAGYDWPYLLYIPKQVSAQFLLAAPNNTGFATTDPDLLAVGGNCTVEQNAELAERLGTPLLVPLFPRPPLSGEDENLYLHALSRASLTIKTPKYARVDLQFAAMLDDAKRQLANQGINISQRVLLNGFSASASFASRFAMLHPDRVKAVAAGSPGGWPIVPATTEGGSVLTYPIGIADLGSLIGAVPSLATLRRVAWFFFLGSADHNDSVPYRDSFTKADESLIFSQFGSTPVTRWNQAEHLYLKKGLNARFKVYPEVGHSVSAKMQSDIEEFFLGATRAAK